MYNNWLKGLNNVDRVRAHSGSYGEFLTRYEGMVERGREEGSLLDLELETWQLALVADVRNLRIAWDYLAMNGGEAPGPSGKTYADFSEKETWSNLRLLGKAIELGEYRPSPGRIVEVPKSSGKGTRPLVLQEVWDRVVQRAILQILQPLIDPEFDSFSFGGRPRRGVLNALATLEAVWRVGGGQVLVTADIANAFEQVPHGRFLDVLRHRRLRAPFVEFIEQVITNPRGKGLRQGGAASTFFMNIYLDHFLDRPWRKRHPDLPLLRYVDDIAIAAPSVTAASDSYEELAETLHRAAMPLKGNRETAIHDLGDGDHAPWLGFLISADEEGGLKFKLPVDGPGNWWDRLRDTLSLCHTKADSPAKANQVIAGMVRAAGPAYPHTKRSDVYAELLSLASSLGFEEVPTSAELEAIWRSGFDAWQSVKNAVTRSDPNLGSARQYRYVNEGPETQLRFRRGRSAAGRRSKEPAC